LLKETCKTATNGHSSENSEFSKLNNGSDGICNLFFLLFAYLIKNNSFLYIWDVSAVCRHPWSQPPRFFVIHLSSLLLLRILAHFTVVSLLFC